MPTINFKILDDRLMEILNRFPLGLASGKMGICIYFYTLNRIYNNKSFESIAENILDDIFLNIGTHDSLDLLDGLSGIGLGINYLIEEKHVEGNVNFILKDIDDIIFTKLSYSQNHKMLTPLVIMHLVFYLNIRLKKQKKGSEQGCLFKELIIQAINILYERIDISFFEEPSAFTIDYQLPLLLYILSQIHKQDFYNYRIDKIIDELAPKILSILPTLHANKLFLLWSMSVLQKEITSSKWNDQVSLLVNTLDIDIIVTDELRDKNVFVKDGLISIYLLMENMKGYFPEQKTFNAKEKIFNKICHSQVWEMMKKDIYFANNAGLFNGYCGVSLFLQIINGKNFYEN